jgi:hypothetical protein
LGTCRWLRSCFLWLFPLGLRYSLNDSEQLAREFTWGLFFSPAADLCISTEVFFVFLPIQWVIFTALVFDGEFWRRRYLYCFLLTGGLFALLFACQFVIDQSWPFLVDNQNAIRLRMIPFLSFGMHTTRQAHF